MVLRVLAGLAWVAGTQRVRARLGRMALAARTVPQAQRGRVRGVRRGVSLVDAVARVWQG